MKTSVRPVNLDFEQEELLDFLGRNLKALPHRCRFHWLYQNNPAGGAWSWFAYEEETRKIIGVASVFPRVIWAGKSMKRCGQVGDFAVDIGHRSLGPAMMLQRATFSPVNQGVLAFCYDCPPHDLGMATFRRFGLEAHCQMYRYARPLKTDRWLTKHLGDRRKLVTSVAGLSNRLLDRWAFQKHAVPGLEISLHTDGFGEEFSWLDEQVGGHHNVIRSRRLAEDLNWRYREDPLHQYQVLAARRHGELVAFVIFSISDQDAYIIDLFGLLSPDIGLQLVEAVVEQIKKESVQILHALNTDTNSLSHIFSKSHFSCRSKAANIVAYAHPCTTMRELIDQRPCWSFNHTDIMV